MTPEVAEAAKVIENTQRDVNIAMMNEFALIFHRLGIDTQDVLANERAIIYDIKGLFPKDQADGRL